MNQVAIVGKGPGWENAPADNGVPTWGVNDVILRRPVDLVFHMHKPSMSVEVMKQAALEGDYCPPERADLFALDIRACLDKSFEIINRRKIPLITLEHYPEIPTSRPYPLQEMVSKYGSDYFGSCIDYALVYAFECGFDIIDLYGFVLDGPYDIHKSSAEYWIGFGRGKGFEINVMGESNLLKTKDRILYGFGVKQGIL